MSVLHDFECTEGHTFEREVRWNQNRAKCQCGKQAKLVFLSKAAKRCLRDPIVLFKHADGDYGVPGRADAPTPAGAERIEVRSMQQYDAVMKDWNGRERSKADRGLEAHLEAREQIHSHARAELAHVMAQTTDPLAKDVLRAALERKVEEPRSMFRPFVNEALEMNSSNREACYDGRTGHSRHK